MYKLIAMDFDGTLLTTDKKITNYTKNTLQKLKEQGYIIVGVTARTLGSIKSVVDVNLFDYLIINNGSYIYDVKNNSGNYEGKISKSIYTSITEELKDLSNGIDYCSINFYYFYRDNSSIKSPFIKMINSLSEIEEEIVRMNIHISNQEKLEYFCDLINNKYDNLHTFIMQDSDNPLKWLVVNPKGVNKGIALKRLGDRLNINLQEMIFFGDGPNDLEVMDIVGCSVAMENALPEVKIKSKYITLSNNEDGIAVFLEKNLN